MCRNKMALTVAILGRLSHPLSFGLVGIPHQINSSKQRNFGLVTNPFWTFL